MKEKIMASPEWNAKQGEQYARDEMASAASRGSGFDDMDDDIPF
jgi:hypothetical protein